jgi:short-subunit dehydrogenase
MGGSGNRIEPSEQSSGFTLITGANSGIGLELAREAAADGRNLILVALDAAVSMPAAEELKQNIKVHTIAEDLSQPGAAPRVFDRVRALGVEVDRLINDAGFGDYGALSTTPLTRAISLYEQYGFRRSDEGPNNLFGTPLFTMVKVLYVTEALI